MAATLVSAIATCVASLFLGQAALRLAGASRWSWLAPPVGISIAMIVCVPAIHVPGRCATVAAGVGVATLAAAVWCLRSPAHRPPLRDLLASLPVVLMTLIPFLAVGRWGILGTSLNNDMAPHMSLVEAYLSQAAANVTPLLPDYPLGPHAMVAMLAEGFGIRVDQAFAGWSMAMPVLTAWTALALVQRASWLGRLATATVVGMPFLIAAYYGGAAFKEVLQATLVLAVVLLLSGFGPPLGRGRFVPLALLLAGIVSVYSLTGLPWPLAIAGLWAAGTAVQRLARGGAGELARDVRRLLPEAGIGAAVLVVVLIPQLPRLERFVSLRREVNGTGIRKDDVGNLIGPLPGWEAFGVWTAPDYRMPASPAFLGGMLTAFVLALVLLGAVWAVRRGRWLLPLAAGAAMAIWLVSAESQSPYVAAKALVVASPLLLALAVLPLVDRDGGPPWWGRLAPLLAIGLVLAVAVSDVRALRVSPVGPTDHLVELRTLRPLLDGRPTLFLGNDDFVQWELTGVPVTAPILHDRPRLPLRPEKAWSYGRAHDFDSVDVAALNDFEWIVTTRDAAGSAPPPQLRLVRTTDHYALWRRAGTVAPRAVLPEADQAGAVLRCGTRAGRALARTPGVAAVREQPVVVPAPGVAPGATVAMELPLRAGAWELQAPYTSPLPLHVRVAGLQTTLPANLDRPGPRWRIGRIEVHDRTPVRIEFRSEDTPLTPRSAVGAVGAVVATPVAQGRIVPLARACGRYVDWYRVGRPAGRPGR